MSRPRTLPSNKEIVRLYKSGVSLQKISQSYGLDGNAASISLKRAGINLKIRSGGGRPKGGDTSKDDEIIKRYLRGESGTKISIAVGKGQTTVYRRLAENGISRRPRAFIGFLPPVETIKKWHDNGKSFSEIASEVGCSISAVSRKLSRAGISITPHPNKKADESYRGAK